MTPEQHYIQRISPIRDAVVCRCHRAGHRGDRDDGNAIQGQTIQAWGRGERSVSSFQNLHHHSLFSGRPIMAMPLRVTPFGPVSYPASSKLAYLEPPGSAAST